MNEQIANTKSEHEIPIRTPTSFKHGPVIGTYMGHAIYDYLIDNFDIKRVFTGTTADASSIPRNAIYVFGQVYEVERSQVDLN